MHSVSPSTSIRDKRYRRQHRPIMSVLVVVTTAYAIGYYGGGSGPIYMDDVRCNETDTYLTNCSYLYSWPGYNRANCLHWEDVGVDCSGSPH